MFKGLATMAGAVVLIMGAVACDPGTGNGAEADSTTFPQATWSSTAKPLVCKKGYHRVQIPSKGYSYHYKCVKNFVSNNSSKTKKRVR